ncbi:MAG: asparagine synthetase B, partial [Pyrinomonadaceae bacterium]|nr:asparagine synthetase B [Sphingobacteriaceae bacterium]
SRSRNVDFSTDFFTLFQFSAKNDIVPTMLTQDHEFVIKGFNGQTTAFRKEVLKPNVLVMAETKSAGEARYIHGEFGSGQWTFYGGHDPERSRGGGRGNQVTDLNLHPNSPGYRLILNNILFPAARKKKQKT